MRPDSFGVCEGRGLQRHQSSLSSRVTRLHGMLPYKQYGLSKRPNDFSPVLGIPQNSHSPTGKSQPEIFLFFLSGLLSFTQPQKMFFYLCQSPALYRSKPNISCASGKMKTDRPICTKILRHPSAPVCGRWEGGACVPAD